MTGKTGWAFGLATTAVLLIGVVIWAAWSVRVDSESSPQAAGPALEPVGEVIVEMDGLQFRPSRLEIPVGTVVTFVNRDPVTHNVVQTTPSQLGRNEALFSSPRLEPGESWSFRFDQPGRYPILCLDGGHYAVGMLGTITVYEAGVADRELKEEPVLTGASRQQAGAASASADGPGDTGAERWAEVDGLTGTTP